MQKYRIDALFILLILAVGLLGVFYRLDVTPPGAYPWSDESDVASDAVASVRDGLQFHYPAQLAGGPVAVWLETGWMLLFGKSLTGLRVLNGLVNVVSVLLLYILVQHLPFADRETWPFRGPSFNQWLGLTAALFFAGSTWILGLARIATPNWSLVPPTTTLTFIFLWRALVTNRRRYFVACGIMTGWAIYNYIPAYFVPVALAIFLGLMWRNRPQTLPSAPLKLYLLPFVVAFFVALPILTFFALYPDAVMQRVVQLAHTNKIYNVQLVTTGITDTLSAFGILPNWILQGEFEHVAFDPFLAVLFLIGLVIALTRRRDPVYQFLLIWWVVMIMPAFLSRSASLGFIFEMWRRGIGAQPVSFVFAALTVLALARWIHNRVVKQNNYPMLVRPAILPGLVAVTVTVSVGWSYWLYFERWANSGVVPLFFAAGPVRLVEWMETESDSDTLFIFPGRPNVSPTTRPELFTVRYMFEGKAATAYPLVDETTLDQELSSLLEQHQPETVHLMLHDRIVVDPKEYFEYALGWRGQIIARHKKPDYNIITYRLYDDLQSNAPAELDRGSTWFYAANVDFGQSLRLVGTRLQPNRVTAGRAMGVALRWAMQQAQPVDYNTSLTLLDARGYEVAQVDKPLLSPDNYLTTRHWPAGSQSTLYYTLPIPPDAPPGQYSLRVVAYNAETGVRLRPTGGQPDLSLPLAGVNVRPNPAPVDPAELAIGRPLEITFPGGLQLLGAKSSAETAARPGARVWVTLWWRAAEPTLEDMGLELELSRPNAKPVPLFTRPRPIIEGHPTSAWPRESVYRANYRVRLPATLTGGNYRLAVRLINLETDRTLAKEQLIPLPVKARPRVYQASAPANPVNTVFGNVIRLNGFEINGAPEFLPGQTVTLNLQWQALRDVSESYKIFVHLVDETGQIISQIDTLPQKGVAPTSGWVSGEIIVDTLALALPPEMPGGPYQLRVGLYHQDTGKRLTTTHNDDHVVLIKNVTPGQ